MASESVSDNSVVGASQKGHRRGGGARRSVQRAGAPRTKLSKKSIHALTPAVLHEWDSAYGLPVLRGEIPTCKWTYLAVLRHYEDLHDGHERGLIFSPDHAWHIIHFIERFFRHVKGPLARQPMLLDPWQKFHTAVLYGWRRVSDGGRRFSRALEVVPRKNGKSTWKAPQGVYLFAMDREVGAEVYAIATTRSQALTVFTPAFDNIKRMVRESRGAAKSFRVFNGLNQEKVQLDDGSVFEPLPANAENLDGKNPSAILFDELHAQKTRDVWDVMESAMGARTNPLLSAITTAGYILDGICTEMIEYLKQVLLKKRTDDAFFGYIYTIDDKDDPFALTSWKKANPGLGMSKQLSYMQDMARKAVALPSARANFLTKDLNVFCGGSENWIDAITWSKGGQPFDPKMLLGRKCYGGLDLASTRDLTAYVLVFPPDADDGEWYVLAWFWCPQEKIDTQEADDRANYKAWQRDGWLTATPGNVTDYKPIEATIRQSVTEYEVVSIGFDRWNAQQLSNTLTDDGLPLVDVAQNTAGMHPGSQKLEILVYGQKLRHRSNPVLAYCADNVALLMDSNGNFRPDKKRSKVNGRIDGIVATCIALSRAVHEMGGNSFWETTNATP